ncbi:3-methyladenine DNA glycosylase [Mycolicibacterium sp. CBMA 361]|uniref:3-methyladenine DNA glycosylase n=1 Tax=Mycolicibacterium sp. CBMA 361 TaxID=2606610 RepID=UPI0012DBE7A6|nr:3-methyladenine DNA glycosylase [Mycolicibacterium sp. CBMA 361]
MVRTVSDTATLVVLAEDDWATREQRYLERVEAFLAPHEARMRAGRPHPVWDFLFTVADLLAATASRPARLNCFGLHEWAMVYRAPEVRHDQVPLRLGASGTDAVVESMPLRCSHFDAYRFFTDAAVPRNSETLTRHAQSATEQPGCVHANMDLYKWSYKLGPLLESNLLMDCLDLAADARVLDMQASPYDLRAYGIEPIAIEDSTGRAEYARRQQDIANRAVPLRHSMLNQCQYLLALADGGDMS